MAGDRLGFSVAGPGDVDGDGTPDFAAGAPQAGGTGHAFVFSGADASTWLDLAGTAAGDEFGFSLDGAGDVDGDDRDDLIVGARLAGGTGLASVFDADGAVLFTLGGQAAGDWFGYDVAGVGDVDGDGQPDLAVGAPQHAGTGRGYLFSGDGAPLLRMSGQAAGDLFALAIESAGDIDGGRSARRHHRRSDA